MKLVVTIPAYNEEKTIQAVIKDIPKRIAGLKTIDVLVVDDGSDDKTAELARKAGAKVISNSQNRGLAYTFRRALDKALELGADIIVNTDADNQYVQGQIPKLLQPIFSKKADVVIGSRFKGTIEEMSLQKYYGNKIATLAVKLLSGLPLSDAQSGFRAFSREAALKINVFSSYTYVQETILEAADKGLRIIEVPVDFRKRHDKSRLISNIFDYAMKAGATIVLGYLNYRPLKVFLLIGGSLFTGGLLLGLRVLLHYLETGLVQPYLPSAVLSGVLLIIGFQIMIMGLLAEMIKHNRKLTEEILYRMKKKG